MHYFAVLIGVGATTVNAYLAEDAIADRHARGLFGELDARATASPATRRRSTRACSRSCPRWASRSSRSYRGGCNFEAVGLSRSLVAEYFPGMPSRISGIGLRRHRRRRSPSCTPAPSTRTRVAAADRRLLQYRRGGETPRLRGQADPHAAARGRDRQLPTPTRSYAEAMRTRWPPIRPARPARLQAARASRCRSTRSRASPRSASAS